MAHLTNHVTVARDGRHNAFTDLAYFKSAYWVSYRNGTDHISQGGVACLAVSHDRTHFREAARIVVDGDARDPHLLQTHDGRLALYFGVAKAGAMQQHLAFSDDGVHWGAPIAIAPAERWLWRIVAQGGRYYAASYHGLNETGTLSGLEFMASDDLLTWRVLATIGTPELGLNECGLLFRSEGECWVVARSERPERISYFCRAQPPYKQWLLQPLAAMIHAPAILEHKGAVYVAGRRWAHLEGEVGYPLQNPGSLGVWQLNKNGVTPLLRLPATGDCSYPGFIEGPEGRVCLSYYSQHAYDLGVLPRGDSQTMNRDDAIFRAADIFFAEIELP